MYRIRKVTMKLWSGKNALKFAKENTSTATRMLDQYNITIWAQLFKASLA